MDWASIGNRFKAFFENLGTNYIDYILQIILFSCLFYYVFKILKDNKARQRLDYHSAFNDLSACVYNVPYRNKAQLA